MLIAEDLLLLLVDDRTGRFLVDSTKLDNVLAGAVLVELAAIERVGFAQAGHRVKRVRMEVLDPTPPGDRCWTTPWPRSRRAARPSPRT